MATRELAAEIQRPTPNSATEYARRQLLAARWQGPTLDNMEEMLLQEIAEGRADDDTELLHHAVNLAIVDRDRKLRQGMAAADAADAARKAREASEGWDRPLNGHRASTEAADAADAGPDLQGLFLAADAEPPEPPALPQWCTWPIPETVAIIGEPGAGKSTVAAALCAWVASRGRPALVVTCEARTQWDLERGKYEPAERWDRFDWQAAGRERSPAGLSDALGRKWGIIVVDPLLAMLSNLGESENENGSLPACPGRARPTSTGARRHPGSHPPRRTRQQDPRSWRVGPGRMGAPGGPLRTPARSAGRILEAAQGEPRI